MRVPRVHGVIRRRLLLNFRVDPAVMARQLPEPFRPKLHRGFAIAGVCLIRLEHIRPRLVPSVLGLSSENAAHRVAVEWADGREGVYIPRRDSSSWVTTVVGGRLFPGEHHRASFDVRDAGGGISLSMTSRDRSVRVSVSGAEAGSLPPTSVFSSIQEASQFFERGSLGYSLTGDAGRFDGLVLDTRRWAVSPLAVESVTSSFFEDRAMFPAGSVEFDHGLIMRNVEHQWLSAPDLYGPVAGQSCAGG
jgi:uncharacterized protein YqjF (DUF2071 family)